MRFIAFFPLLNHTEELDVDIKATKPTSGEELQKEITKAKNIASKLNLNNIAESLDGLENQLENELGSADGKMKILDGLRKALLKLDEAEKTAKWPEVKEKLKKQFYDLEDLIRKLTENGDDDNFNMDKINAKIEECRDTIDKLITQEPSDKIKLANELLYEMSSTRTIILIHLIPEKFIENFDNQFNRIQWKDLNKARSLINVGLSQSCSNYNRGHLADIVFSIYQEMKDPSEFNTGTLG